ncbi:MAG: hypothetical protein K6F22_01595 [Prevotella sp.]|nr:hypothetical protein [Prevotella sp.]
MTPINRKKAILMAAGLEACLLAIFVVLFVSGTIKMMTFVIGLCAVSVIMSAAMFMIIRKLPPM